ncbi:SurA N-terminal domain-containing protein [Halofilum ochraceum]|uniref:SurA N-terminal domain-containing protein n=1 Tax=Halofilum ochraceum TaxID=1611323 RepID=UPI0008DB2CA8|nr:SurA N-terminal domain-containing protein [Halofilum ochraceum]
MLQSFKDRIRGSRWLGYTIVGIISVPFALWGIQAYMGGGAQTAAVTVNGEEIPSRQVERLVAQQRQTLSERFGGSLPEAFSDQMLRERVLEQLISRELLEQTAADANLQLGEQALAERIRGQSMFQRDGGFDRDLYRQILGQSGLTPSQYETRVRDSARVEQLRQAIVGSSFVLEPEARRLARLAGQERRVVSLRYGRDAASAAVEVEEEAVETYYQENRERFRTPEQVRVAWVELDIEALKEQVEVSEEDLRREYESAGQRYRSASEREAAHILIEVPEDATEDTEQQALDEIRSLRERLEDGADFAELAREYSDDSGSARQGGDLGAVKRGMMVEPFEEALFALSGEGSVSEPVRTTYGYHLIKLLDVREREQEPFEEVKDEIRDDLRTRRAQDRFYERVDVLQNTAYENPDSLEVVAEATGVPVQRSEWISRDSGEGIGSNEAVREAAFSPTVLDERRNSDVIELGERRIAVIRVTDHREPQPRPLDEVRAQVRERVESERIETRMREWSQSVIERLNNGASFEEIAAEGDGVDLVEHGWVRRGASDVSRNLLETAFGLAPPGSDASYADLTLSGGTRAVVAVREIRYPEVVEDTLAQTNQRRARIQSEAEFRAWMEALRAEADITRRDGGGSGSGG